MPDLSAAWFGKLCLPLVGWSLAACAPGEPGLGGAAANMQAQPEQVRQPAKAQAPWVRGAQPILRARLEYAPDAGAKPVGVLARDLDADGRAEWIGLTREPGSVQITGGASPRRAGTSPAVTMGFGDWPLQPAWIGDSARMVFATRAPDELVIVDAGRLWKQQDAGSVLARRALTTRARVVSAGVLGGQTLIAVIGVDDTLALFDEQLEPVARTPLADPHACVLHFNADGSGFVVGFQGSRTLRSYARGSDGKFTVEDPVVLSGLPRALHECDLDGDGDSELACALGDDLVVVWGLGSKRAMREELRGTPRSVEVARVPIALASMRSARGMELVTLSLSGQEFARLAWRNGAFECVQRGYAGQNPSQLALGDFDGVDGPDLVTANTGAERWSALFAGSDGLFLEAESFAVGRSPHSVACADLDGDGRVDVGVIHALEGTVGTLLNRDGKLVKRQENLRATAGDRLTWIDVDADGRMDAVWISREGSQAVIHTAYGDGTGQAFERADRPPLKLEGGASDMCWQPDSGWLLVSDADNRRLVGLRAVDGVLKPVHSFELDFAPRCVQAWMQDGKLLVALGHAEQAWSVHQWDAAAPGKLLAVSSGTAPGSVRALYAGDLDGDGREDLACLCVEEGTDKTGKVQVVLGSATGLANSGPALVTGARPFAIAAADINGDGRSEIAVSAQNSHQVNLWIAQPDAALRYASAPDLGVGTGPLDLLFRDLDGDGVPELLVTCAFSDELRVVAFR